MTPRPRTVSHTACLLTAAMVAIACPAADEDDSSSTADATDTSATDPSTSTTTSTTAGSSGSEETTTTIADTSSTADSSSGGSSDSGDSSTGDVVCGAPLELGVYTPDNGNARGFEIVGDTVYLAVEAGGIAIVDITDPSAPAELGVLDLDPGQLVHRVASAGDIRFVGMRASGWAAIDVADPATPVVVYEDVEGAAQDLAFADGVLYVADVNGVQVFDVADPMNPSNLVNDLVLPGSTQTVAVAVVDYADPANPAVLFEVAAEDTPAWIEVSEGRVLYTEENDDALHILDGCPQ